MHTFKKKQGKFDLFYCPCTGSRIRADHEYLGSQNNVCQTQKSNGIGLRKVCIHRQHNSETITLIDPQCCH